MFYRLMTCALLLASLTSSAADVPVEYSKFYSHLKKIDSEETQALQFAFGFLNVSDQSLCNINDVQIITKKKTIKIDVKNNRFILPTEKALKLAKAMVLIGLKEASNKCDLSTQLETKTEFLKGRYSKEELIHIFENYEAFFDKMGGIMSFLMPSVEGLNVLLDNKQVETLTVAQINQNPTINFPTKPLRITPLVSK